MIALNSFFRAVLTSPLVDFLQAPSNCSSEYTHSDESFLEGVEFSFEAND